mgnify:CR=1 FL=1
MVGRQGGRKGGREGARELGREQWRKGGRQGLTRKDFTFFIALPEVMLPQLTRPVVKFAA